MLNWESCSSSSCILSLMDSKSIDGWSVEIEAVLEFRKDGVVALPAAGAGAMATARPNTGCRLVSYTHSTFLERTQLLQGVSLLQRILRRLQRVQELMGHQRWPS